MTYESIGHMFAHQAHISPSRPAFWAKKRDKYYPISWQEALHDIEELVCALWHLGYRPGDRLAILSENRYEWVLTDLACLSMGIIDVPIYPVNTAEQCKYVISHSESKIIMVSNRSQLEKILSIDKVDKLLSHIIVCDPIKNHPESKHVEIMTLKHLKSLGKDHFDAKRVKALLNDIHKDTLATIIYTSGTTANPKGVCLKHGNFLSNSHDALTVFDINDKDLFLSFLPLSHVFERMAGLYTAIMGHCEIAYAENINAVSKNMQEIRPTLMLGVPRFFEKLYSRVQDALESAPPLKKWLIAQAIACQENVNKVLDAKQPLPLMLKAQKFLWDQLVFKKLHAKLGGRLRFFISGGAPLSPSLSVGFRRLGITVYQGYGLTESSPVIAANTPEYNKPASVGKLFKSVEVKIAKDGEILTRGPHVMVGYYKDDEASTQALAGGWLHTGDIGYLDGEGYLHITDRKKDIIITSGGKNVAPSKIENMLKGARLIEHAVVIGDQRKYLTCLIVPDQEAISSLAKKHKLNDTSMAQLYSHPLIQKELHRSVQEVNKQLASFEQVKKFRVITEEFSVDTDDLTPTLKVKKNKVLTKYHALVEDMYQDG